MLQLTSLTGRRKATIYRVDADHGSLLKAYAAMNSPAYPTQAQILTLRGAAQLPAPETLPIHKGQIALQLAPDALVLIELR
jgi:xylan 1,4-beta-xylosidase